ncbi:ABC transporter ATP-binding protein [Nonomuraea sp. MG754425]|uniref:ABC transporter ATP-binding protein n=1 Tax=Nonomuraea sp. MG754425 TaxID=2570319 RepID=UPI001F34E639|nr:ABC transporter ATP-binding protein [Nonomuraea sp. MG754425]MCF6470237.1 ABC transporter ATP-binding protein [Nonomuraea sp. MG754425]
MARHDGPELNGHNPARTNDHAPPRDTTEATSHNTAKANDPGPDRPCHDQAQVNGHGPAHDQARANDPEPARDTTEAAGRVTGRNGVVEVLRVLPRVSPALTTALTATILLQALLSSAFMLASATVVADVAQAGGATGGAMAHLTILIAVFVARLALTPLTGMISAELARRLEGALGQTTLEGALRPVGIGHLSDPGVADRIQLAQGLATGHTPGKAVTSLARLTSSRLNGIAAAILLATVAWWLPLPLAAAWIAVSRWRLREVRKAVAAEEEAMPGLRHAAYARDLAIGDAAAKEVRVFGFQDWLHDRFTRAWLAGMDALAGQARPLTRLAGPLLLAAAHAVVFGYLAVSTAGGGLDVAAVTIGLQATAGMAALGWIGDIQWMLTQASATVPHALAIGRLDVEAEHSRRPSAGVVVADERLPAREIRLEDVRFGYPGRTVLKGLDLTIPAGSSLAVVGMNGAGKSTLIKLLARLYEPVGGRITIDGADLRTLDPIAWRRQLAIVFQDFVRYELPLRDNVGFGRLDADRANGAFDRAAKLSGLNDFLPRLPAGWDTPLSRRFEGGTDLSGGQWQRVALARALFAVEHGARVLVLDEPTANLDVRAEAQIYEHFLEITRGLTTILVSHRFATVRLADRICVIDDGQVAEYGSHEELMALGGRYAHLFTLQSEPFREAPHG